MGDGALRRVEMLEEQCKVFGGYCENIKSSL